jgi:phosphatidylglycerophosphate synthase
MPIFTAQQIEAARSYKYSGSDNSILAKLFLRRFWNFLIEYVPIRIAPNVITLVGFIFELFSFILSFILSHGLATPLPFWACLMNGISLFIYQTLDNLDGRQARRTGSSSALGQFFDHGCDALTGVFELVKSAATAGLGASRKTFWFVFLTGIGFFLTSFEEYVTGTLYLGVINGPDEGLFALAIIHIMICIAGDLRGPLTGTAMQVVFCALCGMTIIPSIFSIVCGDCRRAAIGAVAPFLSIALTVANFAHESRNAESIWFTMFIGLVLQYQAQQTIVAHLVLKDPLTLVLEPTIIMLWVMELFPLCLTEIVLRWYWPIAFLVLVIVIIVFDVRVIVGLSRGLGIPVFTIKQADPVDTITIEADDEIEEIAKDDEPKPEPEIQVFTENA